jgi:predicted nucleic acid-binding Zn ribbon protein
LPWRSWPPAKLDHCSFRGFISELAVEALDAARPRHRRLGLLLALVVVVVVVVVVGVMLVVVGPL